MNQAHFEEVLKDYKHKLLHQKRMDTICDQVNLNEPKFIGRGLIRPKTESSRQEVRKSKMISVVDTVLKSGTGQMDLFQEMKNDLEGLKARKLIESTNKNKFIRTELYHSKV